MAEVRPGQRRRRREAKLEPIGEVHAQVGARQGADIARIPERGPNYAVDLLIAVDAQLGLDHPDADIAVDRHRDAGAEIEPGITPQDRKSVVSGKSVSVSVDLGGRRLIPTNKTTHIKP